MITNRQEQIITNKVAAALRYLKREIGDDYRSNGLEGERTPSMDITLGMDEKGGWAIQTGDNSFTGNAYGYPYWGTETLTRRCNAKETARRLVNQCLEQIVEQQS